MAGNDEIEDEHGPLSREGNAGQCTERLIHRLDDLDAKLLIKLFDIYFYTWLCATLDRARNASFTTLTIWTQKVTLEQQFHSF